jgi:hypothetical protein
MLTPKRNAGPEMSHAIDVNIRGHYHNVKKTIVRDLSLQFKRAAGPDPVISMHEILVSRSFLEPLSPHPILNERVSGKFNKDSRGCAPSAFHLEHVVSVLVAGRTCRPP